MLLKKGQLYGAVSMPVLAALWPGNRRAKTRAGTIGGAQSRFAHAHKATLAGTQSEPGQ